MKRFQYRLAKLLGIKRYYEQEWELKLARITGQCVNLRNQIEQDLREQAMALYNQKGGDLEYRRAGELYRRGLSVRVSRSRSVLEQKEQERAKIQLGFLEASKERKILEKLKEKKEAAYYREQKLEEVKAIDDISHALKNRGTGKD